MIYPNIQVRVDDKSFMNTMNNIGKNSSRVGDKMLYGMAKRCQTEIRKAMIDFGHYSSGNLYRRTKVRKLGKGRYVISMPKYIVPLEEGSRPHNIPFNTRSKIWARQKGFSWIQMWRIIKEGGTKAHPFVTYAVMKARMRFESEVIEPTMNVWLRSKGTTLINT